ncbi:MULTISPECIES: hemin uptake protein HemP [Burkholderia cepacia complex]|uniref:hemin uptake protein HemP n=1 Tax=Burkholderia cepacia complex TaxID=87882 RepID=UPI00098233DC|nr:hemin uptake protein HemP [Burkholderia cenocepacia]AQQ25967.1 hemin transporter HemP [Burkholderia cenocepacia]MBR8090949.1 hemin uptake protein HemP [Burkholderia cenocepacia]ONV85020.1 hemin transporter HemP [Burkholderia cenocepacia]ONW17880.1 hemin transporter HemP [Burkholderia cenocepacia]ONW25733.1 hemin transporter HemP [Burkholderia cenocepacia]
MTDTMRPTTLTLRRTTSTAASNRQKTAAVTTPAKPAGNRDAGTRVVNSDTLLQGHSHISIAHNGETYQLRATRLGKLILTK